MKGAERDALAREAAIDVVENILPERTFRTKDNWPIEGAQERIQRLIALRLERLIEEVEKAK